MKNNKQKDKEKVFRFLKKYITLAIGSFLIAISIVFILVYHNLEVSRLTGTSINSLLQLGLSSDTLFDSIRKLMFQIFNDTDITSLVNDVNSDTFVIQKSTSRLNSYSSTCTNINSIYVYSRQNDSFYTTVPNIPKNDKINFFDKEAVKMIDNIQGVRALYPIPRRIVMHGSPDVPDNTVNIYTFIYYGYPEFSTNYINKVVIINVSEDWVKNSLELWSKGIKGNVCIMNKEGILVSNLYNNEMFEDISQEEFASKILKSEKETGYFISNVSGVKSFATYAYSDKLGWYFIRIIPYGSIYENLAKIGLIAVFLLLIYIAIGYVLSYIITGKAKRSIDDIIDALNKEILDNRTDLDKLKDEFLYNSLYNNIFISKEQIIKDFNKYKIVLSADNALILILFRIDHYYELRSKFKSYDIALLKQALIKTASEIFRVKYFIETVDMKDDHIILAINEKSCSEHMTVSQIDNMIELVQDTAEKNIKISLSAVLSPSGYTFNDINLLYTEVKQASNYRMFYGLRCIIHSEELAVFQSNDYVYPTEKEKMLIDALMLGKVEAAGKLLYEILESTKGYAYTVLSSLLLRLTASISTAFESIENIGKYSIDYNFNSFMEIANRCETLDEIKSEFYNMFNDVFSSIEQKKNSKYELLINQVIDIINQGYSNENLCLNSIAAELNLSPGYLSKLFRTYTMKSVGDYINQIRVDKALKLLEKTDMPINEVAASIGFSCCNYFYTIFKKVTGITPTNYRQIKNKNQILT